MRLPEGPLRIIHCFRAPVGGLFRHVQDLAREQEARGHAVGVIAGAKTGGAAAEAKLEALAADLTLGVRRVPMPRQAGIGDIRALRAVKAHLIEVAPDIVHGHGAKGGTYARLATSAPPARVYTPHGGSLHYSRSSPVGLVYLEAERFLARKTEAFLFESAYGQRVFERKVGSTHGRARVVHNGLPESDFQPVSPAEGALEFLFVGELRQLKGVSELLRALALLHGEGRLVRAVIGGDGPDAAAFRREATILGLGDHVAFPGARPAREFFPLARCLVVPSRAESLPYIVLEAGAAGIPTIATDVGGVAEIFGPLADRLVPARDPQALARAMARALDAPEEMARDAEQLRARIRDQFSLSRMTDDVLSAYAEAMSLISV